MTSLGRSIVSPAEETARAIERDYRMTAPHQWARELLVNAAEAGATKVVFGPHVGFARQNIWRMQAADNGSGMDDDEIVGFYHSYGASGKPVGGEHENMGIGAKTSLLPWNTEGMVVISVKDGVRSMIHVAKFGEVYGLREFVLNEDGEKGVVVDPDFYDDEYGVNWAESIPEWIEDHGTVVVLLGSKRNPNTYMGNPDRSDIEWSSQHALSRYLNGKFWDLGNLDLKVVEFQVPDPEKFDMDKLWQRTIVGFRVETEYANGLTEIRDRKTVELPSSVQSSGRVVLSDGTGVVWCVHTEGVRARELQIHPASVGVASVLHRNEMFTVIRHPSQLRAFGLTTESMRKRVSLIIEPQDAGPSAKRGVYMTTDRSRLLVRGGKNAGQEIPMMEWAEEFFSQLPEEIRALHSAGGPSRNKREMIRELVERFGARWAEARKSPGAKGTGSGKVSQPDGGPSSVVREPGEKKEKKEATPTDRAFPHRPSKKNQNGRSHSTPTGGGPDWEWLDDEEFPEGFPHGGQWIEGSKTLQLRRGFPAVEAHVNEYLVRYPHHDTDMVRGLVEDYLGYYVLARVMHAQNLQVNLDVRSEILSEGAISLALLGIVAEEGAMAPSIGGKLGRRAA